MACYSIIYIIYFQIAVVMYLLYQILGISAIIGATVCVLTMIPLQFIIGRTMSRNGKSASVSILISDSIAR